MKRCPKCGASIDDNHKFCSSCGEKITNVCSSCGKPVSEDDNFCTSCGTKL